MIIGRKYFTPSILIILDQIICALHDLLRWPVIESEFDNVWFRAKVSFEVENDVSSSPPEPIDHLIIVTHASETTLILLWDQKFQPLLLISIQILYFVNQHVLELLLVLGKYLRAFFENLDVVEYQVSEIAGVLFEKHLLVVVVDVSINS